MAERRETPQERWQKKNAKRYTFAVMKNTEADIIQRLDTVPNRAGYIKRLIRQDIEQSKS